MSYFTCHRIQCFLVAISFWACEDSPTSPPFQELDGGVIGGTEAANDLMSMMMEIPQMSVVPNRTCNGLYGLPNERSGVDEQSCSMQCLCADEDLTFSRPPLDAPLFTYRNATTWPLLEQDPYQIEWANTDDADLTEKACVIEINHEQQSYRLETMNLDEAPSAYITHLGPCGACSSLRDLKVYLDNIDLTEPVRSCGLRGLNSEISETVSCLQDIGFSDACAEIWAYNTKNTRESCLDVCLAHLQSPYVDENGELNPCLDCDEQKSGPIFKKIAGRTRRNSGLASAICRPCNSVSLIFHSYLEQED